MTANQADNYVRQCIDLVADSLKLQKLLLFIGAGCSAPVPSSLPLALPLCQFCWDLMTSRLPKTLCAGLPNPVEKFLPEQFFALASEGLGDHIYYYLECLSHAPPNLLHYLVANLAGKGLLREVLTTNFDSLIERACDNIGISYEIRCPEDCTELADNIIPQLRIIKLHGTLRDKDNCPAYHSLCFNTFHVDRPLPKGIVSYLRHRLTEFDVLVLGYSGRDPFDIAPILREPAGLSRLTWIQHTDSTAGKYLSAQCCRGITDNVVTAIVAHRGVGDVINMNTTRFLREIVDKCAIKIAPISDSKQNPLFLEKASQWAETLPKNRAALAVGCICSEMLRGYLNGNVSTTRILEYALNTSQHREDTQAIINSLRCLAIVKEESREEIIAERMYIDALERAEASRLNELELDVRLDYGTFLVKDGRKRAAQDVLRPAYEAAIAHCDAQRHGQALVQLGYAAEGDDIALYYFKEAIDGDYSLGFSVRANVLAHMVRCLRKSRRIQELHSAALKYIVTLASVRESKSVFNYTDTAVIWPDLIIYSVDPLIGAPWRQTERELSRVGLQDHWVKGLHTFLPIRVKEYENYIRNFPEKPGKDKLIRLALQMVDVLSTIPCVDLFREVTNLLVCCVQTNLKVFNEWLTDEKFVNASDVLRRALPLVLLEVEKAPERFTTMFCRLADTYDLPVLGSVAAALEDLSLRDRLRALMIVWRLTHKFNPRTRETAAASLEKLAQARDKDALKILQTLAEDPYRAVYLTARKYLHYYVD